MFESQIWRALSQFSSDRLVFVESESKKIGNLRVPEKLMLHMRLSPCLRIDISTDERVKLLIEDYPHLVRDTGQLLAQLEHLTPLHGHEKIRGWRALAESGDIPALVKALLEDHYDPAYLKSIGRNFEGYKNAVVVGMPDITAASFSVAAAGLTTRLEASGPEFT
jgi:tRNA 2-selenouridine synthase